MTFMRDLHVKLLSNVGVIALRLPREDRIAFLDLVCEYQAALPEQRSAFSERLEPYLNFVQTSAPSSSGYDLHGGNCL